MVHIYFDTYKVLKKMRHRTIFLSKFYYFWLLVSNFANHNFKTTIFYTDEEYFSNWVNRADWL